MTARARKRGEDRFGGTRRTGGATRANGGFVAFAQRRNPKLYSYSPLSSARLINRPLPCPTRRTRPVAAC